METKKLRLTYKVPTVSSRDREMLARIVLKIYFGLSRLLQSCGLSKSFVTFRIRDVVLIVSHMMYA